MSFETRYSRLNDAQKRAVDTIDGPVMIVAGPGTGKTELLSVRIANILKKTDTLPENILCLTFTESGQAAMRERLTGIIGKDAYKVAIHTFHSFGSEIMSQNREYFYNHAQFEPADELKRYEIIRSIFDELPYTSLLASKHNGEYVQLPDALKAISDLKRNSALTSDELRSVIDQNDAALDTLEPLLRPIIEARVGKRTSSQLQELLGAVAAYTKSVEPLHGTHSFAHVFLNSLSSVILDAEASESTKPISAWKAKWFERNVHKELVFKDRKRHAKLREVAHIYYQYLTRMEKEGLYDFDDMIMQVVHALETQPDLRYNLQERYLYIMVDEFQDTNLAQLRIVHSLTDNPVNEGTPNILVVGDDDQAIYSFQGADISNILTFSDVYPSRTLVALTDNYRSGAAILEASRAVITQGMDRLETRIPELNKTLAAHRTSSGSVEFWESTSIHHERYRIVQAIKASIESGEKPHSIAVLAKTHADIKNLLPYFMHAGVSVRYEHQENALESEPVTALIAAARIITALASGDHDTAEAFLPEFLAHPAWNIPAVSLWRLSLTAHKNHQTWMEVMATTPEFTAIHEWLVERSQQSLNLSLEEMLDQIIGVPTDALIAPYYTHYFSTETLDAYPAQYLEHLAALRAMRTRLRDYSRSESPTLADFVVFIDLHVQLGLRIAVTQETVTQETEAVWLMTAHKSKGLEFDTVYVVNSVDSTWGQRVRTKSQNISYPANLPLAANANTPDERMRLYYVAMTRAKERLILTYSTANDADKATLRADFLLPLTIPIHHDTATPEVETSDELLALTHLSWNTAHVRRLAEPSKDLATLLEPTLAAFKLSATSFTAFLNVSRGGPRHFLLNNLLHFPKAKGPAAVYGTAIHATMQKAHTHILATGELKPLEDILHDFEVLLAAAHLSKKDFAHYLEKGSKSLTVFISSSILPMTVHQRAEVSLASQAVHIGSARITGVLDVVEINEEDKTITVIDYKTGSAATSWGKGSDYTRVKLHQYRQQLLFYKLLIENSGLYSGYTVTEGKVAFIEPDATGNPSVLSMTFDDTDELKRLTRLIEVVWNEILALALPDTSGYPENIEGIIAFEDTLIDNIL